MPLTDVTGLLHCHAISAVPGYLKPHKMVYSHLFIPFSVFGVSMSVSTSMPVSMSMSTSMPVSISMSMPMPVSISMPVSTSMPIIKSKSASPSKSPNK